MTLNCSECGDRILSIKGNYENVCWRCHDYILINGKWIDRNVWNLRQRKKDKEIQQITEMVRSQENEQSQSTAARNRTSSNRKRRK